MLMHSQILVYNYDALWRRRTVPKCAVVFLGDVVFPQKSDNKLFYGENGRFRYSKIRIESGI